MAISALVDHERPVPCRFTSPQPLAQGERGSHRVARATFTIVAEAIAELISDTESRLVQAAYVVIYAPQRNRKRFPENCVNIQPSEEAARSAANPGQGYHTAVASGPSRSSEGFRLYYLLRWLD